jgi:hypothetical protein
VTFDVQVSADGRTWTTALAGQRNATWGLEQKALPAGTMGRHVRLLWHNDPAHPVVRFAVYELEVHGPAGPAPSPSPSSTPSPAPSATPTPGATPSSPPSGGPTARLVPVAATADGSYPGLPPGRAIDGDPGTQWASEGYKAAQAELTLDLGRAFFVDRLRLKTGALPGIVHVDVLVSDDGVTWRPAAREVANATWGLEEVAVVGHGRFVRLRFVNDPATPIARFQLFEAEVYGRSSAVTQTRSLAVDAALHAATYGPAQLLNAPGERVTAVTPAAFQAPGVPFPAMLHADLGRFGLTLGRITARNAAYVSGDLGNPGAVSFLDEATSLADDTGAWTFTTRGTDGRTFPIVATTAAHTTTWRMDRAASLDLGSATRRWLVTDGGAGDPTAGVLLAYRRPDGAWDFTVAAGNAFPSAGPNPIVTQGRVYAFFLGTTGRTSLGFRTQD